MQQSVVAAGGSGAQVAFVDKQGMQPAQGKIAHDSCAGDAAADDKTSVSMVWLPALSSAAAGWSMIDCVMVVGPWLRGVVPVFWDRNAPTYLLSLFAIYFK